MSGDAPATWEVRAFVPTGGDPEDQRFAVVAQLRDAIREAGHTLDPDTVQHSGPTPVTVRPDLSGVDETPPGATPDGHLYVWRAGVRHRQVGTAAVAPASREGDLLYFTVPDAFKAGGEDLSLRHGLGGPVTVYAYTVTDEERARVGYYLATALDDDTVAVLLHPGTDYVTVEPDVDQDEGEE